MFSNPDDGFGETSNEPKPCKSSTPTGLPLRLMSSTYKLLPRSLVNWNLTRTLGWPVKIGTLTFSRRQSDALAGVYADEVGFTVASMTPLLVYRSTQLSPQSRE